MSYLITRKNGQPTLSDFVEIIVEDKASLPDAQELMLAPGSVAFTAGLKNMWQLDMDRQWVAIIEDEG